MAMYNFNISSFADAERLYNTTKPIRGTTIVPLGDRRRKWERIVKVSPTCYKLCDTLMDKKYETYNWYQTPEQVEAVAAVTWTLGANKNSVVEFRNGEGDFAHTSRYSFLHRCMPRGMSFVVDSGKQYVRYREERHFLPKANNKTVVFKDAHTPQCAWRLVSNPHPLPVVRKRVNKEEKEPYKEAIVSYLEWVWNMAPLIEGTMDWHTNMAAQRVASNTTSGMFRAMLMDSQHEQRTTMLHAFLCTVASYYNNRYWHDNTGNTINGGVNVSVTSDPKVFRTKFNAWINDRAGFNETFNEYKG